VQNRGARAGILGAAVAAIVVLFLVLSGGDDEGDGDTQTTTTTPAQPAERPTAPRPERKPKAAIVPRVVVRTGEPVGGVKRLSFDRGDRVVFEVRSDVADEVHVHGYDLSKNVRAGSQVRFSFPARIEGVFEIELEARHTQIAELRVTPG
jgi:hypothetical protein